MALTATAAVALAAWLACVASGGYAVGGLLVTPAVYGLALVPGVVAVAAGRRPAAVPLPPQVVRYAKVAGLGVGLYLFAGRGQAAGLGGLVTVLALAAVALGWVWPRPEALRLSLAFAVVGLLAPEATAPGRPSALVAMGTASAVALVATARLAGTALLPLGGVARPTPPRRVALHVGAVAAVLALAAVASLLVDPPSAPSPEGSAPSRPEAGDDPVREDPAPLGVRSVLDPGGPGPRRGDDGRQVVLRVRAARPALWRAQTFDRWDGRRWVPEPAPDPGRSTSALVSVDLDGYEVDPSEQLVQRVRIEATYAAVAVGAPKAYFFHLPGPAAVTAGGAVLPRPALGKGATYEVTSARSPASPADLRGRDPSPLLFPDPHLSARSRALAERVAAGAPTAYDKVTALQAELASRVVVDDAVPALPGGADVVDSILFELGRGSPERLATTLALLARSVGVPARVATGFLPGRRPLPGGDFVVRARDAHVWVEVPFTGMGWQAFDATGRLAEAERADSSWARLRRFLARWWPAVLAAGILLLALAARRALLWARRRRATPWAARYLARLSRAGAKRGRPRHPAETPAEYASALGDGVLGDERLHHVGRLVTEAAWSGRDLPPGARRWAEDVLRQATGRRRRS
ncbi:MAG: transglutaminase family protein [Actinomycetota bacterium]